MSLLILAEHISPEEEQCCRGGCHQPLPAWELHFAWVYAQDMDVARDFPLCLGCTDKLLAEQGRKREGAE